MTGFEDLGALLLALRRRYKADPKCKFQKRFSRSETPLLFTLVNYRDVSLKKVLPSPDPNTVHSHFQLDQLVPEDLPSAGFLTTEVAAKGMKTLARFIATDCLTAETSGVRPQAYNKIKHGGVVVSNGAIFFPNHPPGPAVIDSTQIGDPNARPLTVFTLPFSQDRIEEMKQMVWLTTVTRRIIVALYLWKHHRVLLHRENITHPGVLFDADMRNILSYKGNQKSTYKAV